MKNKKEKSPVRKTIALAGNPNSGKTTLFNLLTKSHQHIGNWPGVTVERKEGRYFKDTSLKSWICRASTLLLPYLSTKRLPTTT